LVLESSHVAPFLSRTGQLDRHHSFSADPALRFQPALQRHHPAARIPIQWKWQLSAYLAPGQIAFTAFFAVAWSGSAILVEYRNGYMDKLRATPIYRTSILVGELAPLFIESAIMAGGILALSVVLGATIKTGLIGAALILVLSGLFGMAWAGTSFVPALLTKSEQATGTLSLLFFPIAFMSTAFVPPALMPRWLQTVNSWNPITFLIEAIRPLMVSGYDWAAIGKALVAIAVLGLVLQSATLWAFRRLTA